MFIFQIMLQDERRPPVPVPRGGAAPARGAPPGRSASSVLETLSNASVGLGTFLFRGFLLFWFRFWVFACFGFVFVFTLFCQRTEREGSGSARAPVMCNRGSREGRVCSTEGGLHPGGPSALSRPPTRDKLPVPQSSPRAPRNTPSGKGRGSLVQPRCRVPALQPWPSPTTAPTAPGARRCTKLPCPCSPSASGHEGEEMGGGSAAARRVCGCAGRKLPAAPSCSFQARGASPCSPGRQAGLLRARAAVTTPRSKPRLFVL